MPPDPPSDQIPRAQMRYRRRRLAVLALRLPRFLPHAIPWMDPIPPEPDHACSTELTNNCV